MIERIATVRTGHAGKYVRQLCKHWAHTLNVVDDGDRGIVRFDTAVATLTPSHDALLVAILANDEPTADHIQSVVARHLDRFAFREAPLRFDWRAP